MIEYLYKGFKISYNIIFTPSDHPSYKAMGSLTYLLNYPKYFTSQAFNTEHLSYIGAEVEIKKLIENHIDYELKNFYDSQGSKIEEVMG